MPPREIGALLAASGLLATAIALDHGHYSPRALVVLLAGCAAAAIALRTYLGTADDSAPSRPPVASHSTGPTSVARDRALAVLLILLLIVGALDRPGFHIRHEGIIPAYVAHQWILATLVALSILTIVRSGTFPRWLLPLGICSALAFRIGIVLASPEPAIDVWWQMQQSAAHLLDGLNPYTTPVSDPTRAAEQYGYVLRGYGYPPGTLLLQTVSFALLGDVRYAAVVADVVTAAIVWRIVRPVSSATAALLALLVLHQPRSLFVIEQGWQEPILATFLAASAWVLIGDVRDRRFGMLAGLTIALKQYLVVFVASSLTRRRAPGMIPWLALGAMLAWLPFLLWDPSAAVSHGLWSPLGTPFRPDGLTLWAPLHDASGFAPSILVATASGLAASVALAWFTRKKARASGAWLYSGTLALLAAFLLGNQAFANYYHLVVILLLVLIAVRLRECATDGGELIDGKPGHG